MDESTSQLTNKELNSLMDKWENETLVQIADQAEERGQTEELNSLMDKMENETLLQIADQAEGRGQTEELNSLMDKMENETLLQIADQAEERGQTEELNSLMDKMENETFVQIADQAEERGQTEELYSLMNKMENETFVQIADQTEGRGPTEELNSLMDKMENETLLQIADQAEERGPTEEPNSVMDKWENETLVQIADQAEERVQLEPTLEQVVSSTKPSQSLPPVYAVLDVETTRLDRKTDRIVQIGIVKVENNVSKPWMAYVNPCKSREEQMEAYEVHKISPEFLLGKPKFADVVSMLCEFLENVEYVVCHNCVFDWSILMAEFDRLQDNEDNKALMRKIKWVDLLRIAIKSFPDFNSYGLSTLLGKFSIRIKKAQSLLYLYQSCITAGDQQECEVLSLFEQGEKENFEERHHDAVCDSLAAHSLLKIVLEKNSYSDIADLVNNFPQCLIETELFLALEVMLKERKTSDKDLTSFSARAEKFCCTIPSLRGKTLQELSVSKIRTVLLSGFEKDERVRLIYRAALLHKGSDSQKRKADSPDLSVSPKETKTE